MNNNKYHQVSYLLSAHNTSQLPPDNGCEVAFAGRSNVGKSSVINAITGQKRLARISKTPGRTQMINFFSLGNEMRLVDLPGYGYARVPQQLKAHWGKTLAWYFERRKSLQGLILIVDIRRSLTDFDLQMLSWCESARLPVHILLNKADKLSYGAAKQSLLALKKNISSAGYSMQLFSALKKSGVVEVCEVLDSWFYR